MVLPRCVHGASVVLAQRVHGDFMVPLWCLHGLLWRFHGAYIVVYALS